MFKLKSLALSALAIATLSACGGGGISIGPIPSPSPSPKNSWQLLINGTTKEVKENDLLELRVYVCQLNTISPLDYFSQYHSPNGQRESMALTGLNGNSSGDPAIRLPVYIKAVTANRYQVPDTWLRINAGNKAQIPTELSPTINFNGDNHFSITQSNGMTQVQIQPGSCPSS
ncbi:hypothetical protein [Chitinibacter tainanensis]|uniref:hypothetical protein n=1 Tax=Chitinibacter tainanensis TaxID=230667 RepID=UPI00235532CB|nr:hypothetical protein [Chitinibacter tainanensis]